MVDLNDELRDIYPDKNEQKILEMHKTRLNAKES